MLESITCSFSSKQRPTIHLPSLQCFFPLVTSCLLSMFYFCCSTITITTTTTVSQLLLIPLCKQVFISGAVELTTQLSKPVRILWLPSCRINKLGYLTHEDYLDPPQLRVIKDHENDIHMQERNELDDILLRQPAILKHNLPVEPLGILSQPKEDRCLISNHFPIHSSMLI